MLIMIVYLKIDEGFWMLFSVSRNALFPLYFIVKLPLVSVCPLSCHFVCLFHIFIYL